MLTTAIATICAIAAAGFILFAAMCIGIRRDDRRAMLSEPARGIGAVLARRFTGVKVQPRCSQTHADPLRRSKPRERAGVH